MADSDEFRRELSAAIQPYRALLDDLVGGRITPEEFEDPYFRIYAEDPTIHSKEVFDVIDGFFADVDSYVRDPRNRKPDEGDLGPDELRARARMLIERADGRS